MSTNKKKVLLFWTMSLLLWGKVFSQSLPDSIIKRIDSLYIKWNTANGPGCSVGIVRNDTLVFSKGYGFANLEYDVHLTDKTIFNMASVSKQITGYCIVLLARQGKLSLDEDIHVYLPLAPDFGKKITVRHLLNHTSGIRDQMYLIAISGLGFNGIVTQDLALNIINRQRTLNFIPGEQYSYSNSNFILLAEIVKAVSGKSFRSFADSSIFKPLGMSDSHFQDDYKEPIKNRAVSYQKAGESHYGNDFQNIYTLGETGLFSNIIDMSKWVMNFYEHKVGDQRDIDQLCQRGVLNNGKKLTYALGITNDTWKGWRQYSHGGATASYRTHLAVFPDLKLGFIVFSNVGDFNPEEMLHKTADLFIKDTTRKSEIPVIETRDITAAYLTNTLYLQKYLGNYIGDDGLPYSFDIKNNRLYYNEINFLIEDSKDSFSIPQAPEIQFIFAIKGKDTTVDISTPEQAYHLKKYKKEYSQTDELLRKYTGSYYCPELDCNYGLVLKNHQLVLTSSKYNDSRLTLIARDHLVQETWENYWMHHLQVIRDKKNNISGFEVNSGRMMHLRFNKLK